MTIFVNFVEKNVKFLAIFLHSNGNFPDVQVLGLLSPCSLYSPGSLHLHVVELLSVPLFKFHILLLAFVQQKLFYLGWFCRSFPEIINCIYELNLIWERIFIWSLSNFFSFLFFFLFCYHVLFIWVIIPILG